jgi:ribosomal protein S18 acetylase RimI-like enzyme
MSRFTCVRLARDHDRKSFRCGADELDAYLVQRAGQDMRRQGAAVFVLVPGDQPHRIAGYYTLSSASILLGELPEGMVRRLPRYPVVPAVLIGRLARDVNFPGIGRLLLFDALARALRSSAEVAATVVLVDAKNETARRFYARYGFREVLQTPNRMYLPMKTIEDLLSREMPRP